MKIKLECASNAYTYYYTSTNGEEISFILYENMFSSLELKLLYQLIHSRDSDNFLIAKGIVDNKLYGKLER